MQTCKCCSVEKNLSKFSKTDDISVINSLDNLQPMWSYENLKKGNR